MVNVFVLRPRKLAKILEDHSSGSILKTARHPLTSCLRCHEQVKFSRDTIGYGQLPITARLGTYASRTGRPYSILDRMLRRGRKKVMRAAALHCDAYTIPNAYCFSSKDADLNQTVQWTDQEKTRIRKAETERKMRKIRARKETRERRFMHRWLVRCRHTTSIKMLAKAKEKARNKDRIEVLNKMVGWTPSFQDRYYVQGIHIYPYGKATPDSGLIVPSIGRPRPDTLHPPSKTPGARWWIHGHSLQRVMPSSVPSQSSGALTSLHLKRMCLFLHKWLARSPFNTTLGPSQYIRGTSRKRTPRHVSPTLDWDAAFVEGPGLAPGAHGAKRAHGVGMEEYDPQEEREGCPPLRTEVRFRGG